MSVVEDIYVSPERRIPLRRASEVRAIAGEGLEGDRYQRGTGSFSRWPGAGRAVSLIEGEALDAVFDETGIDLRPGQSRRNIVTRGVRLPDLVARRFRVGTAVLRGERLCLPCAYLDRLAGPGVFAALRGRGGLRADVIEGGVIRVGDAVVDLGQGRG